MPGGSWQQGMQGMSQCRKAAWGIVVPQRRAAHHTWGAQAPSPSAPQGAWCWLGEQETFWEKKEDKGQDAEG